MQRLIRLPQVLAARGRRKTAHYNDIGVGLFTPPVQIGPRAVAWPEHEIDSLNAARVSGKTDDEIRALVRRLISARKIVSSGMVVSGAGGE